MSHDPEHWTESFFSGAWLDVQRALHPPELSAQQAASLCELLDLQPGDRVLDAPCGNGRIALALARLGLQTVGVDRCRPLLEDARAAAQADGLDATFHELDLREVHRLARTGPGGSFGGGDIDGFQGAGWFQAALCIWGSFGYFGDGGLGAVGSDLQGGGDLDFARAVAQALPPGGFFLIDTPCIEQIMAQYQGRGWWDVGGVRVLEQRAWDPIEGVMHVEWTLIRGEDDGAAEVELRQSEIRIYSVPELARLLTRAGFSEVDVVSDFDGRPWTPGDRAVVVATR
ncbi:MAG: methyltransferase domain-containing protein [Alphaproteobacteria bacterium]|nr:methyltransferase domain-containing protein [Alphaproteobacteria bacterium]